MGNTVQRPSIDYLPAEMVQEIFRYLPTSELLRKCRLVSHEWSQLATAMCRTRHIRFKMRYHSDYSSDVGVRRIFVNALSLPWTSVHLNFTKCPAQNEFIEQLCEGFGSNVQSLRAFIPSPGQYNHFFRALQRMPNLQDLEILLSNTVSENCGFETCDTVTAHSEPQAPFSPFEFPPDGEVQLLQLKHLQIRYYEEYDNFFEFLEFMLLNSGAQLESLHLPYVNENADALRKMVKLLCIVNATIPELFLGIYYGNPGHSAGWELLAQHRHFRIDELHVLDPFIYTGLTYNENFRPLERFLGNSIGLTYLSLESFHAATPASKLHFPMLHDLKTLDIEIHPPEELPVNNNRDTHNLKFWFNPIQPRNFPNLEHVSLHYSTSDHIVDINLLFEVESFHGVKSLKVFYEGDGEGFRGRWSTVFPNVTKISCRIEVPGQIRSILDGMQNVTELKLKIWRNLESDDNDVLLHGAMQFILPLKSLTKLILRNNTWKPCCEEYSENVAFLFMQLHPLFLKIDDHQLKATNRAVIRLRKYHLGFQHFKSGKLVQHPPTAGSTAFDYIQLLKSRMILVGCVYLMHKFNEFLGW